ncbi:MAG: ATP-binding cassette domain-containing protein, partial [Nitrospinaceae bacterium]|nr:ATP-binding cassette domain-containing protein [Nitrospinaceae bacterium]
MLNIKNLNQFYGESHTLWDVDLDVLPGTCTCLMGRNGVGKTTLLKSIMGLVPSYLKMEKPAKELLVDSLREAESNSIIEPDTVAMMEGALL